MVLKHKFAVDHDSARTAQQSARWISRAWFSSIASVVSKIRHGDIHHTLEEIQTGKVIFQTQSRHTWFSAKWSLLCVWVVDLASVSSKEPERCLPSSAVIELTEPDGISKADIPVRAPDETWPQKVTWCGDNSWSVSRITRPELANEIHLLRCSF